MRRANLALARKHGATIHTDEKALRFEQTPGGVTVTTDRGSYSADRLYHRRRMAAELIGESTEAVQGAAAGEYWFEIDGPIEPYLPENFPAFLWELRASRRASTASPRSMGRAAASSSRPSNIPPRRQRTQ